MFKKISIAIILTLFLFACANKEDKKETAEMIPAAKLTVEQLNKDAEKYVDKIVEVTGTVVHVCKHGGKRMFLIGEDPEQRFKFTAGDKVGSFDVKLEGSDVIAWGIVEEQKVDAAYLDEWEKNVTSEKPEAAHSGHEHEGEIGEKDDHKKTEAEAEEDDHHSKEADLKQIADMREQLKSAEKGYLAFYSVKCSKFEEKPSGE